MGLPAVVVLSPYDDGQVLELLHRMFAAVVHEIDGPGVGYGAALERPTQMKIQDIPAS